LDRIQLKPQGEEASVKSVNRQRKVRYEESGVFLHRQATPSYYARFDSGAIMKPQTPV